jgi:hypothetical protein
MRQTFGGHGMDTRERYCHAKSSPGTCNCRRAMLGVQAVAGYNGSTVTVSIHL